MLKDVRKPTPTMDKWRLALLNQLFNQRKAMDNCGEDIGVEQFWRQLLAYKYIRGYGDPFKKKMFPKSLKIYAKLKTLEYEALKLNF